MPISLEELKKQGEIKVISPEINTGESEQSPSNKIFNGVKNIGSGFADLNKGFVKTLGKTALNIGQLGSSLISKIPILGGGKEEISKTNKFVENVKPNLKLNTKMEKIGGFASEIAQLLTPIGAETMTVKSTTILDKILVNAPNIIKSSSKMLSKSGVLGTELAGKTAVMTGDAKKTKEAGIIGAITPPAVNMLGKAAKFTVGEVIPSVLSGMTGIAPETIKTAFKNPIKTAEYISSKIIPVDVREKAVQSLNKYEKNVGDTFEEGLNGLKKLNPSYKPSRTLTGQFSNAKSAFQDIIEKTEDNIYRIFNKFSIAVKKGELNFEKLNSAIVSPTERSQIIKVWDTIKNQTDFSVQGVQRVAAKINALSDIEKGIKTEKSAIIGKIHSLYSKAIEKVYPELGTLRSQYSADKKIISGINEILKSSKNDIANPITSTSVAKKLVNLFNEDNEAYIRALKRLEDATGDDLINQFVAANFDKILPGKLGSYMMQAGLIAGGLVYNPMIIAALPLFSPKLMGKVITTSGKSYKTIEKIGEVIPSSIKEKIIPSTIIGGK